MVAQNVSGRRGTEEAYGLREQLSVSMTTILDEVLAKMVLLPAIIANMALA